VHTHLKSPGQSLQGPPRLGPVQGPSKVPLYVLKPNHLIGSNVFEQPRVVGITRGHQDQRALDDGSIKSGAAQAGPFLQPPEANHDAGGAHGRTLKHGPAIGGGDVEPRRHSRDEAAELTLVGAEQSVHDASLGTTIVEQPVQ
jgi:hypothetical protein